MRIQRTIKSEDLIQDIRSGVPVLELTDKYEITPQVLDRVLQYLVDVGLLTCRQVRECEQLSSSPCMHRFVESCDDFRYVD
ncbi:MAG: hypothetical protein HY914_14885 [Desulfomonile tiedjei]|nr:hypothetical protein [Desulfomonile tiedjei]